MADLNDVMLALGRVQEGVDRLRDDFTEEKQSASISRKSIYERQDDLSQELIRLKSDVQTIGLKVDQNKSEIQPSIDDWRRIKNLGLGVTGILALGGLSVGAMMSMGMDAFKAALRHWLGG